MEILQKTKRKPRRPKLRLIQGGNDFLTRRSKAMLTLIINSDSKQLNKVG